MTENTEIQNEPTEPLPTEEGTAVAELTDAEKEALALEEKAKAEKLIVDDIFSKMEERKEDGSYLRSYTEVAEIFNEFFRERGNKKRFDEMAIVKLRVKYGRTAPASHRKGEKYVLGRGNPKKAQEYVVQASGEWRKAV